jgi:hypothetical protein
MADVRQRMIDLMQRVRERGQLPSSKEIIDETFEELGYVPDTISPDEVMANFNSILREAWEHALVVLERHEERVYATGITRELSEEYPDDIEEANRVAEDEGFLAGVTRLLESWYPMLRRAFLSVSQSRKQRGGKDFELQIEKLLDLAEVPYFKQEPRYRTDLILPDLETFERNKTIAVIVSVKRTLRERWAEVAEELFNLRSPNVFLFTADENVTGTHVERICGQYNIHLVVWDHVKAERYPGEPLVLGYTEWANERLAVLRQYW